MDRLPPELVSLAASFTDRVRVSSYATISRHWQVAVETITFRSLRVQSSELAAFAERLATPHRRAALDTLTYNVILPGYSEDRCAKFERRRERDANNAVFSEATVGLFSILKSWEEEGKSRSKRDHAGRLISLHLGAFSLTDVLQPRPYDDMGAHRYERSILTLRDLGNIPEVRRITGFHSPGVSESTRTLRAASIAQIASKLPNLKEISWRLEDCAFSENEIRHTYRRGFAEALLTINTQFLTEFYLHFPFADPLNDAFRIPSGTDPINPGIDELSQSLYSFLSAAPNLRTFILSGPMALSSSLFGSSQPPTAQSCWPNLRKATVEVGRTTPAGTWLFVRDPENDAAVDSDYQPERGWASDHTDTDYLTPPFGSSDEGVDSEDSMFHETYHPYHAAAARGQRPERHYRTKADAAKLEPFMLAASRAAMGMPKLEECVVWAGKDLGDEPVERQIYLGFSGAVGGERRKVEVETKGDYDGGPKWNPSDKLRNLWEEWVGKEGTVNVWLWE